MNGVGLELTSEGLDLSPALFQLFNEEGSSQVQLGVLPWFVPSDDLLKYSNASSSFSFPVLWIRIQSLQHVKRFRSIIELAHL